MAENKGVFFEIEGHTDATGEPGYNEKLGEDRAMAVRDYLHDQHGIALSRMEVISYGETKPVADNKTEGQARPEPARGDQGPRVGIPASRPDGSTRGPPAAPRRAAPE